jgi:superfamily II DNA or RNA helicase
MEYATPLPGLSFTQKPRDGQQKGFELVMEAERRRLNAQFPTGYGKSYLLAGTASLLNHCETKVNRGLVVVPTEAQSDQFIAGLYEDKDLVRLHNAVILDLRYLTPARVLAEAKKHRDKFIFFVTTIQSLIQKADQSLVDELMRDPNSHWLIGVDEYHHYGIEKAWSLKLGRFIDQHAPDFVLAMSATPYRPGDDSYFGAPDIRVTYGAAVDEKAVKPLRGHRYDYLIEVDMDGEPMTMTTRTIVDMAGGATQEAIEQMEIKNHMRWRDDYLTPLIDVPLRRLLDERLTHGLPLQAIIGAFSVAHAKAVCAQVDRMFAGTLKVNWVGTGPNGRKPEDNQRIIRTFCPPKEGNGKPRPAPRLDVIVHVGMAGEGLDTRLATEVVHLNAARMNNQNNQENGRAARFLASPVTNEPITGNVNFDGSSEYAPYTGKQRMHAAMDMVPPPDLDDDDDDDTGHGGGGGGGPIMPPEPVLVNAMELEGIDSGDPDVAHVMRGLSTPGSGIHNPKWKPEDFDPASPQHADLEAAGIDFLKRIRRAEMAPHLTREREESLRRQVEEWTGKCAALAARLRPDGPSAVSGALIGKLARAINTHRKTHMRGRGVPDSDEAGLREHYAWTYRIWWALHNDGDVPTWLAQA